MKTFWFNLLWADNSLSERFSVQVAPDRDTALKLAAMEIIGDEGYNPDNWEPDGIDLLHWVENTFEILSEGEDIATGCPNCTSHDTTKHGWRIDAFTCNSCGFDFISLGFSYKRAELERAALENIANIPAFEDKYFNPFA